MINVTGAVRNLPNSTTQYVINLRVDATVSKQDKDNLPEFKKTIIEAAVDRLEKELELL